MLCRDLYSRLQDYCLSLPEVLSECFNHRKPRQRWETEFSPQGPFRGKKRVPPTSESKAVYYSERCSVLPTPFQMYYLQAGSALLQMTMQWLLIRIHQDCISFQKIKIHSRQTRGLLSHREILLPPTVTNICLYHS